MMADKVKNRDSLKEEINFLCSPGAEVMSDGQRLTQLIKTIHKMDELDS